MQFCSIAIKVHAKVHGELRQAGSSGRMKNKAEQLDQGSSCNWCVIVLVLAFAAVLAVLVVLHFNQQADVREAIASLQARNIELGLPRDFPLDDVPIYPGLAIIETDHSNAESNLGEPLDYWYVHGLIDEDKDKVYDYYHEYFMGRGMHQQQYIGIPTGYGADYADEEYLINLIVETRAPEERMQVELKVHRVR